MNEKIYDAMMKATDTPKFNNGGYYWPPEYVERFALLITRVCADAADMAREGDVKYAGDYVMESLGFECGDRQETKNISPLLLALAGKAEFDISQYNPNADIEGLPMTFLRDYGELIVKECAQIAKQCREDGAHDVSSELLMNFQIDD